MFVFCDFLNNNLNLDVRSVVSDCLILGGEIPNTNIEGDMKFHAAFIEICFR